jgi:ATP synthase protein I
MPGMGDETRGDPARDRGRADTGGTPQPGPPGSAAMRTFAAVGSVGLSFVVAIAIGTALGLWLDRVTGWSPFCFIFFFLCGLAAGILNLYRAMSRLPK